MKKNKKLENRIYEMGQLINLGKDEVKYALKSRKNIVFAGALAFFAFIVVQNITYGTLRYQPGSINDFIQFSKFL
jgi:hypothetical protein